MKTVVRLKPRHLQTLTAIQRHIAAHGYAPSVRQLATALGLHSTHPVHRRLKSLRESGALVDAPKYSSRTTAPAPGVRVVVMYE